MKFSNITVAVFLVALTALAAPSAEPALPNETSRYSINWPTGVSLGEATLTASSSAGSSGQPGHMHFVFDLDAGAPAFTVSDRYRADATGSFCSSEFEKNTSHGSKKALDKETFDSNGTVTRGAGSGQSQLSASTCSKDALTFLYFLREELAQGRVPPQETVYFGAPYQVRFSAGGTESLKIGNASVEAQRIDAAITGPSSSINVELFFLKDRARTLAMVRVPLSLGKFSMELVK
jgi:Protein of unknown function (DUF3108)